MLTNPLVWVAFSVLMTVASGVVFVGSIAVNRRRHVRRMAHPVEGTLLVTACNLPAGNAVYSTYRLHGIVSGPGLAPTPVRHRGIARVRKWPLPQRELPVLVDRTDPARLLIRWDRVATGRQDATAQTQRLAQAMRQQEMAREHTPTAAEAATAVVTGVRDVPVPAGQLLPEGGSVELTLDVTRADGTRHIALARALFASREHRARFGSVGARLPIRLDPADQTRATLDYAALDPDLA
jgi:hypothetical protein